MAQYPSVIDLSSLDGDNGFRLDGEAMNDLSGVSVASAGDLNGDGFADLVIGASSADPNGAYSGSAYVVFGKAGGFAAAMDLSGLDGADGFRIDGLAVLDKLGYSAASAGDINGDGFADLIVGAYGGDNTGYNSGSSYVVFGHAGGFAAAFDLSALDGTNGFRVDGAADDISGCSVASAGDVNGDGFADVIVGAYGADDVSGASYVVFGKASGFAATLDLSILDGSDGFRLDGVASHDNSGRSVASAGDVNGDGFDDVIVGARYADPHGDASGSSYVVFGKAAGFAAAIDLSSLDGTNGFRLDGIAGYDCAGARVASAGDINGDGFADVVVGAYGADDSTGSGYVVFGKAAGFAAVLDLSALDGTNGFRFDGAAGDQSGYSVASAGDVNGDGFADLIVGAPGADPHGGGSGSSYVVFGKAGGFGATLDLSSLDGTDGFRIDGAATYDASGASAALAGDVNGDGLDDLIVGAPQADPNGDSSGSSYVVFGRLPDAAAVRSGTVASQSLVGGDLDDVLKGRAGDDRLWGHDGADKVMGGTGNDTVIGGGGADRLGGQDGADTFLFRDVSDSPLRAGADVIKDLDAGDSIDLSAIDADVNLAGDQAFRLVSAFTGQAGELTLTVTADGHNTWLEADTDGDGAADFAVRLRGDHHDFTGLVF